MTGLSELESSYGFDEETVGLILDKFRELGITMDELQSMMHNTVSQEGWMYADMINGLHNTLDALERRFKQMQNKLSMTRFAEEHRKD